MNAVLLLGLVAFLAMRGNGAMHAGNGKKVDNGTGSLSGYTGFAYFPLFSPALPMEDDVPTDLSKVNFNDWVQTLMPDNYYLAKLNDRIYVYERVTWYQAVQRGIYNPSLRMRVVDGVAETEQGAE